MKALFIPAKAKYELDKESIFESAKRLPKNIAIAYSVQYESLAQELKKTLSKSHNIINFVQVLGCSKPKFFNVQAVLLVSDGKFHALSLAYETKLPIYILENNNFREISSQEIKLFGKKKKASYLNFLNSGNVGILISTKPGQENLKKALDLKKKIKKRAYLFIGNNVDTREFENFSVDSWLNTACPRLDMEDSSIINLQDLSD